MKRRGEAASRRFFDRWAPRFETGRLSPWFRHYQERVLARVAAVGPGALLDVGCGTGWLVRTYARRFPGRRVVGLDLSRRMLLVARERAREEELPPPWVEATSRQLPFRCAAFDWITCTASFHHYPEPEAVLREWRRVLRPGGRVLILESCTRFLPVRLYDWWLRLWEKGHMGYRTGEAWRDLLAAADYREVRILWRERGVGRHGKLFTSLVLLEGRSGD